MKSNEQPAAAPEPEAVSDDSTMSANVFTDAPQADPFAGHGGSYVIDPKTGARRLVARTTTE